MIRLHPILPTAISISVALHLYGGATLSADDSLTASSQVPAPDLREIDRQRGELIAKIDAHRLGPNSKDLSHRCRMYVEYYLLDYDDPRTRLGAALAMQNGQEVMIEIIFDLVVHRPPNEEEIGKCKKHMETKSENPREAIEDIIWAICNTKEFVDMIR